MKKMKQLCFLFLSLLFTTTIFASEENYLPDLSEYPARILMNGTYIQAPVMPMENNNHIMLIPLRAVLESGGFSVEWREKTADVVIPLQENDVLRVNLKQKKVYRNERYVGSVAMEIQNGTTVLEASFFQWIPNIQVKWDPLTKTAIVSATPPKPMDVVYYDLGKRTMETTLGKALTYELEGGMAVPTSFHNPVVLLIHGSHPIQKAADNRYDLGFSYLLKKLAQNGYVAVSINANIQYSFEDGEPMGLERIEHIVQQNLEALQRANDGKSNDFGLDLKDKMDFSKVILVGHSRGASAIYRIAGQLKETEVHVAGLLSLAPAEIDPQDVVLTDIPSAIIVPELDGDVISLEGFKTFDLLYDMEKRKNDTQLVYLYGGNHNAFNEALLKQDLGKIWYKGEKTPISQHRQRSFTEQYLMDFVKTVTSSKPIHTIAANSKGTLYGENVMVNNLYAGSQKVFQPEDGGGTATNATIEHVVQSGVSDENTAGLFNHPGVNGKMDFSRITWKEKGAWASFDWNGVTKDFSHKNMLHLYMAQDSTSILNHKQNQSFTVTLVDTHGKKASVLLDKNTKALMYQDGEVIFDDTLYSSATPLGTIDLPLDSFQGVDLSAIKEIRFVMDQSDCGVFMVRTIAIS